MTIKKFIIFIALWSILPLLAYSDIGGFFGFIMIWAVIIVVVVPLGFFVQLVGPESIWAKAAPMAIGGIIAVIIAYVILKQIVASIIAFSQKDMMRARRKFAYGYAMIACVATPLLCLDSLARQWP